MNRSLLYSYTLFMTEGTFAPPPPPPAAATGSGLAFDFAKPFTYVFDDPQWVQKILIGGLFYLGGIFIIGWFFILGYCAGLGRNVMSGVEHPLPEWSDLGEYFAEGLRLVGVVLVYIVPFFVLVIGVMVPAGVFSSIENEGVQALTGGVMGCVSCLFIPLALIVMILLPASLTFAVAEQRFGAAFDYSRIWPYIRLNVGNYLLAVVVYLIARFLGGFGFLLLCIGVVFTAFWSFLITTHAFAQVYRIATSSATRNTPPAPTPIST